MSECKFSLNCKYPGTVECDSCHATNYVPKPEKRIIDLSVCIKSNIDMEFSAARTSWWVDKLRAINTINKPYTPCGIEFTNQRYCRVRQDHWHSWQGGKCPLPEGLSVEVINRSGKLLTADNSFAWNWEHNGGDYDIIAFKVLGPDEGWKY